MLKMSLAEVNVENSKFRRKEEKDGMQDQNNKKHTKTSGRAPSQKLESRAQSHDVEAF
jgi:hypothetical protein